MRFNQVIKLTLTVFVVSLALSACAQPLPGQVSTQNTSDVTSILVETQNQISNIRGLQPPVDLPRTFLTPDEIRQKVENEFFSEYTPEDADKDSKSLWLLGLLPKDFDLLDFYQKLYTEQIGGYYDDETKSMYVVQSGLFSIVERTTYAHEFTHALQDHNFAFSDNLRYSDEDCKQESERCAALQALIEGDASYTETLWFSKYASDKDLTDLQSYYLSMDMPVYDSAPAYMRDDLTFAYLYGQQFVTHLYAQGGFEVIDKAFTELQPVSTEQILHPSRYPDDKPVPVELPDLAGTLGKDWKVVEIDTLGEWFTWLLLARGDETNTRLNDVKASAAAEGWGGDQFAILRNETSGENAIVMSYIWDTPTDEQEASKAFADWLSLRFGSPDGSGRYTSAGITAILRESDRGGFTLVFAENVTTATDLMQFLP
ncbi:MAG: hypothetical protein WBI14_04545 [Anaerolineaceae bacterium]